MLEQKTLKILDFLVQVPHQFEFAKLGHQFYYLQEERKYIWQSNLRPKSYNCHKIFNCNPNEFDIVIVHTLKQCKEIKKWRETGMLNRNIPVICFFHFCPPDTKAIEEYAKQIEGYNLLFNSYENMLEWNMANKNQRVIIHGYDFDELPTWRGGINNVLTVAGRMGVRKVQTGYNLWCEVAENIDPTRFYTMGGEWPNMKEWQKGRVRLSKDWKDLKNICSNHDVYFSTTMHSCFPRARTEAFAIGMPMVCTSNHNSNIFIQHGINGFRANEADECIYYIKELLNNKELRQKFSKNARETASEVLSGKRYRQEWRNFINDVLALKGY